MIATAQGVPDMLQTPPPSVDETEAACIARDFYGLSGDLLRLSSERDVNYCLSTGSGSRYLLKIANEKEPVEYTDLQVSVLRHLEKVAPDLPVPRNLPTLSGEFHAPRASGGRIRLLSFLEGSLLTAPPSDAAMRRSVADAGARLTRALSSLDADYGGPKLLWDLKNAACLAELTEAIESPRLRDRVERGISDFKDRVLPRLDGMRWQLVHGDLNPQNLLTSADGQRVVGILDFGDLVRTPLVCDVAVTASYQIDFTDPLRTAAEFVSAWHAEFPLQDAEIAILPDLIATRLITIITVASWRAARYPANAEYILRNVTNATKGLDTLCDLAPDELANALRKDLQ
ncbi:phosphotransferase [Antarcticimicrobium luteum]|uniref:Hydroxylysine kinase n=1 Tax=Antarcticimicrobium luteum TaxID=2547397 RepID=A0A4R5VFL4_9RHOB|nr:phosphotransferase [Antarcticimicrobium luteum]TDK51398.1 aminotransferase [Antarcticimicrobium luteum]